ncbi:MAG: tRNA (adenosine(37)-N6)-threonylcarbamoyltransferase complex dimerization subunit type 1 TsaB [Armatimonadota bacterium]|nr:tRNA (adenosine(37)-N6)-threonylcarbamoyltransferase complex dimerization subunit type 1 TsaB [Armatimonadota bacterium]
MNLLALDTSTEVAGIALLEGDRVRFSLRLFHRMDLAARLFPALQWLMRDAGLSLADVHALAAGLGPGSFTGVRLGVTTAKILAQTAGLPVVGISSTHTMAAGLGCLTDALVCPCLDARKQEVYATLYRVRECSLEELFPPQALPPTLLAARLHALGETVWLCGTGALRYQAQLSSQLGERFHYVPGHDFPDPAVLAHLARARLSRGEHVDPVLLKPVYARVSEAERSLARPAE